MKITEQLQTLSPKLKVLIESRTQTIQKTKDDINKLSEFSSLFEKNWIGAWASSNYNQYRNFATKSRGVAVCNAIGIQSFIEKKSGIQLKSIKDEVSIILKENREFRDDFVTELSLIKGQDSLSTEIELLVNIENQNWGFSPMDYINSKRPKQIHTYNPAQILNRGLDIPPHLTIDGELFSLFSMLGSVEDFQKNAKKLIRQLELKFSESEDGRKACPLKNQFVYHLIDKFHVVVKQFKNRHGARDTIIINDEYDVQDILHGLLKIEFDDVRAEEYTPSFAGSSTRVDFLLKKEKIVIEVKKTREGLKDKQVGDQLMLDTLHYKTHPECKHLICFVYDPEGWIENPRGLEYDLNSISNEDLLVEVFIRP